MSDREKEYRDYEYEVWRRGGNPDLVDRDDVPEGFDWVWDDPAPRRKGAEEDGA